MICIYQRGTPPLPHALTTPSGVTCLVGLHWRHTEVVKVREDGLVMEKTQQHLQHYQLSRR